MANPTCFGARGARRAPSGLRRGILMAAALALPVSAAPAAAQVFLTQEEAMALAFPEADAFERRTAFLDERQAAAVEAATGEALERSVVTYYVARSGDAALGVAYFDAHRVRTLREVVMVAVAPDGTVARVEILAFREPRDYLPPEGWLDLLEGRVWAGAGELKTDVPNLTGATLSARAVKGALARVLALHRTIGPLSGEGGGGVS